VSALPNPASRRAHLLAVAPLLLFLAALLVYPTLYAIVLAFRDTLTGAMPSLANFRVLAGDPLFWRACAGNLAVPLASISVELVVGTSMALLFAAQFPLRRPLRVLAVLPFAVPEIVFLTVMRYVFAPRGYANGALAAFGIGPVGWLDPGAPLTFATVVAVDAWHVSPVVFLTLLARLAAMPEEVAAAARLDGAGAFQRFWHITLPLLWPAIGAALLLRGMDALRIFATPLVLAGVEGLPVLSTYSYHQWSDYGDDGAAAAAAVVLAAISAIIAGPLLARRSAVPE